MAIKADTRRYRPSGGLEAAMRLRSHRRDLLSDLSVMVDGARVRRPVRLRRLRWWLRTGALLAVVGIRRFVRVARTRRQAIFLVIGALVLVVGVMLRSSVAVISGVLVIGSFAPGTGLRSPEAAMVRTWTSLGKSRADNRRWS